MLSTKKDLRSTTIVIKMKEIEWRTVAVMKKMMSMNMMIISPCDGHEDNDDDQEDDHHDDDDLLLPHLVGGPWSCGTLPRLIQCSTVAQNLYRSFTNLHRIFTDL